MSNHHIAVGSVSAEFTNLRLPMGLLVDRVNVSATGLKFETDPFVASVAEPGTYEVFVSDASLSAFIQTKTPANMRNIAVTSANGKMSIKGSLVMLIEIPATGVCQLRIEHGRWLYVDLLSVNVLGTGATSLVQSQLEKMNPILDVDEFPIRATMEFVEVVDGGVRLTGTIAPP